MQYNLETMSAQEVAEAVAKHLFSQGRQSVVDRGTGHQPACVYRGPDNLKCAAGIFIPDELYEPGMESNTWYTVSELYGFSKKHLPLIRDLQITHDDVKPWTSTKTMRRSLTAVFEEHDLDPSILTTLSFSDR